MEIENKNDLNFVFTIAQIYDYFQKIIELKCKIVRKLVESHDNPKDLLIHYTEKWKSYSHFISNL